MSRAIIIAVILSLLVPSALNSQTRIKMREENSGVIQQSEKIELSGDELLISDDSITVPDTADQTKRYTVGDLTIDVIDNDNWKVSSDEQKGSITLTVQNSEGYLFIIIVLSEDKLESEKIIDEMRNYDHHILFGEKQKSSLDVPGGFEIPYTHEKYPKLGGIIQIFDKDKYSYVIMTMGHTDFKGRDFEDIYHSIKIQ